MQPSEWTPLYIRTRSRGIPLWRAGKMRLVWFLLGAGFGVACSAALHPSASPRDNVQLSTVVAPPALQDTAAPVPTTSTASTEPPSTALVPLSAPSAASETATVAMASPEPSSPPAAPEIPVAEAPPPAPAVTYPQTQELRVSSGDNFVSLLGKASVSSDEARDILEAMGKKFNPRNLKVNDRVKITLDQKNPQTTPYVSKLSMPISNSSTLELTRTPKGTYTVSVREAPVFKKMVRAGGPIMSSLYETITGSGMPISMVGELIKAYSYDVDFQRDIQRGNRIDVVFEKNVTEDGKLASYGKIIYASLDLGDRNLRIYRYTDKGGISDFYNAKGESVRKGLLRTPMNGARISSGFGMREHPILGYTKMHKGVDFAAPTGTPIYASGDGVVSFLGPKGSYGNYLQIKHNNEYASAYAHLSRFAAGMAPGKKVRQGQVIAYVGTTGASTGPHLHYEILKQGAQVNPSNVKFKTGTVLAGNQLKAFKRSMATLEAQLDQMKPPSGSFAMLELPTARVN